MPHLCFLLPVLLHHGLKRFWSQPEQLYLLIQIWCGFEARDQNAINNPVEASIIAEIVEELVNNGVESKDVGIISPCNSQASLIQHTISTTSVQIHTIDKYQGRDKDCILVSFVRSREKPRSSASSLLGDWHRINVALTRANVRLREHIDMVLKNVVYSLID